MAERYRTFRNFYPHYLSQHTHPVSRRLHVAGTSIALLLAIAALVTGNAWLGLAALLVGYALAWIGHVFFEHNRPATFRYPVYSFLGDWCLWFDVLRGRQRL